MVEAKGESEGLKTPPRTPLFQEASGTSWSSYGFCSGFSLQSCPRVEVRLVVQREAVGQGEKSSLMQDDHR